MACVFEGFMGPNSNSQAAMPMKAVAAEQAGSPPVPSPPHDAARLAVGGVGSCSSWRPDLGGGSAAAAELPNPFDPPLLPHADLLLVNALPCRHDSSPGAFVGAGRSASDTPVAGGSSQYSYGLLHCLSSAMEASALAGSGPAVGGVEQLEEGPPAQAGFAITAAADSVERYSEAPPVQAGDAIAAAAVADGAQPAAGTVNRRKEAVAAGTQPAEGAAATQPAAGIVERRKEAPPAQAVPAASACGASRGVPVSSPFGSNEGRRRHLAAELERVNAMRDSFGESRPKCAEPCTCLMRILPWGVKFRPRLYTALHQVALHPSHES